MENKAKQSNGREGKGREGKGREGKGREGKGREGKGREGKGRKGREGKGSVLRNTGDQKHPVVFPPAPSTVSKQLKRRTTEPAEESDQNMFFITHL